MERTVRYNEALALMKVQLNAIYNGANSSLLCRQLDTYGLNANSVKTGLIGTCATYLLSTVNPAQIIPFIGYILVNYAGKSLKEIFIQSKEKDNTAVFVENFVNYLAGGQS